MILIEKLLKTAIRRPCRLIITRNVSSLLETKTTQVKAKEELSKTNEELKESCKNNSEEIEESSKTNKEEFVEKRKPIIELNVEKDSYERLKAKERLKWKKDKYRTSKELLQPSNFNEVDEATTNFNYRKESSHFNYRKKSSNFNDSKETSNYNDSKEKFNFNYRKETSNCNDIKESSDFNDIKETLNFNESSEILNAKDLSERSNIFNEALNVKIFSEDLELSTKESSTLNEKSKLPERYYTKASSEQLELSSNLPDAEKNYEIVDFQGIEDKIDSYEKRSVLEQCKEDISHVAPYLKPTFNFAAYVDKSETLQELLKLGVDLWKIEKKIDAPQYIMGLDFERDVKRHVIFLYDVGLNVDEIGKYITKNPFIFKEDLDNLQVRINYLEVKRFTTDMIVRIIGHNPFWLSFSTQDIDQRLGFFQKEFQLTGNEVRTLAVTQPRLITYQMKHIKTNMFALKEEMSFTDEERKVLLLNKPNLFMKDQNKILDTFQYIHREMDIPTEMLVKQPGALTCRVFRMKQRHLFLKRLGKIQFDPKKPGYISILAIASGNDIEFCNNVAKVPIETYNLFLKTL